MWRRRWILLAALPFLLASICDAGNGGPQPGDDDDDGGVTDPFAGHVACADRALRQHRKTLNGLWRVIDHVDDPSGALDPAVTFDLESLEFSFGLALDGTLVDSHVDGHVEPNAPGEMRCRNGMTAGDVCLFLWDTRDVDEGAEIGSGVLSAVELGTGGALRVTLARENTIVLADAFATGPGVPGCMLEVSGFDLYLDRTATGLEMYALTLTVDAYYGEVAEVSPIRGYVTWGESTGDPKIALHAGGEVRTCDFDLATFGVDCP